MFNRHVSAKAKVFENIKHLLDSDFFLLLLYIHYLKKKHVITRTKYCNETKFQCFPIWTNE